MGLVDREIEKSQNEVSRIVLGPYENFKLPIIQIMTTSKFIGQHRICRKMIIQIESGTPTTLECSPLLRDENKIGEI